MFHRHKQDQVSSGQNTEGQNTDQKNIEEQTSSRHAPQLSTNVAGHKSSQTKAEENAQDVPDVSIPPATGPAGAISAGNSKRLSVRIAGNATQEDSKHDNKEQVKQNESTESDQSQKDKQASASFSSAFTGFNRLRPKPEPDSENQSSQSLNEPPTKKEEDSTVNIYHASNPQDQSSAEQAQIQESQVQNQAEGQQSQQGQTFYSQAQRPAHNEGAQPTSSPVNTVSEGRQLLVGKGISLTGEIQECNHLVVEGRVEAALKGSKVLEIKESGTFIGSVQIESATISGVFEGEITVNGRLTITETGSITGTIAYKELEIQAGARIDGKVSPITGDTYKGEGETATKSVTDKQNANKAEDGKAEASKTVKTAASKQGSEQAGSKESGKKDAELPLNEDA